MSLYLNVPYSEKEEAKRLGAKWDPRVKKWYTDAYPKDYVKFAKWILRDTDDAIIATEYLYLIEGTQNCWKCGQKTAVVGLGIGEHIHMYGDSDDPQIEIVEDEDCEEVHLAWVSKEDDIPPKLLRYMKEHYPVRIGYSKTLGRGSFANHCSCESDLQLEWEMGYCSNDYAYMEFGQFEELILSSDPDNDYISYEELYG